MSRLTVLFVDDEEAVCSTFQSIFSRFYRIHIASNGQDALGILSTTQIHVIVTDQKMPGMSGTDLLKIAKEKYPETVRILVTGYADLDAVIETINSGDIFRFISKPWKVDKLKETIDLAGMVYQQVQVARAKTDVTKSAQSGGAIRQKPHLLFVDGSETQLHSFSETFSGSFMVHTANSAERAYQILRTNPVSVVISEARIGETDGIDFISVIRDDFPSVVPVLLTEIKDIDLAVRLINQGRIHRYFIKPYRKEVFIQEIEKAVSLYQQNLAKPELNIRKIESDILNPVTDQPKPESLADSLKNTRNRLQRRLGY